MGRVDVVRPNVRCNVRVTHRISHVGRTRVVVLAALRSRTARIISAGQLRPQSRRRFGRPRTEGGGMASRAHAFASGSRCSSPRARARDTRHATALPPAPPLNTPTAKATRRLATRRRATAKNLAWTLRSSMGLLPMRRSMATAAARAITSPPESRRFLSMVSYRSRVIARAGGPVSARNGPNA